MSSPPRINKRSRIERENDLSNDTIQVALARMYAETGLTVYYGLSSYVACCNRGEEIRRIFNSTYHHSVDSLGKFVTPSFLRHFTTIRDPGTDAITCIHDKKSKLKGPKLDRILALESLFLKGYDVLIFNKHGSTSSSVLALSSSWELEEDTKSKKRDHVDQIFKLYSATGFIRLYTSPDEMKDVLKLQYISLQKVRSVASKLNALIEKQEFTLKTAELSNLPEILGSTNADAKMAEKIFIEELLACKVENSSWEDKVNAFVKSPSDNLARRLAFCKPYEGKLVSQSTGKVAERFLLKDLSEDDQVQLSTVSIDTKFYQRITGNLSEFSVYKASPDLGIVRDKKGWVKLENSKTISVKTFSKLLKSIAGNNSSTSSSVALGTQQDGTEDLLDNIDV